MEILARGWGHRHAGRSRWAVRDLDLGISSGERVLLLGASGAGKSTLLRGIAGLLGGPDEGETQGQLLVGGKHPTRRRGHVGMVLQDPDAAVVLQRVGDDVAFGCENLGLPREEIWPRVEQALEDVGLDVALDHASACLSGGQKQRLALAAALAMGSEVLLLDEPTANLDPTGVKEVAETVSRLVRQRGTTLVVVEHRTDVWAGLVDRVVVLSPEGGLLADGTPEAVFDKHREALLAAGVWVPGEPTGTDRLPALTSAPSEEAVLRTQHLAIGRPPAPPAASELCITIPAAASSVITGPNGSGKSTLALTLAGLLPAMEGRVVARADLVPPHPSTRLWRRHREVTASPWTWPSKSLLTRIGTVLQNPEHQFLTSSVRDEVLIGPRALGLSSVQAQSHCDELLARLHLDRLAGANPFTLSGGEKRRLSVATVLATAPQLVMLDEPTFGQDRTTWLEMVALVKKMVDEGCAVVSVTHDEQFVAAMGQHCIELGAIR